MKVRTAWFNKAGFASCGIDGAWLSAWLCMWVPIEMPPKERHCQTPICWSSAKQVACWKSRTVCPSVQARRSLTARPGRWNACPCTLLWLAAERGREAEPRFWLRKEPHTCHVWLLLTCWKKMVGWPATFCWELGFAQFKWFITYKVACFVAKGTSTRVLFVRFETVCCRKKYWDVRVYLASLSFNFHVWQLVFIPLEKPALPVEHGRVAVSQHGVTSPITATLDDGEGVKSFVVSSFCPESRVSG